MECSAISVYLPLGPEALGVEGRSSTALFPGARERPVVRRDELAVLGACAQACLFGEAFELLWGEGRRRVNFAVGRYGDEPFGARERSLLDRRGPL